MVEVMNKLTKYEHACLFIEKDGAKLVIDPGGFTELPADLTGINCLIITEQHGDHFNLKNVKAILEQSPEAKIYTTQVVHDQLAEAGIASTAVQGTQTVEAAGFKLSFYETDHAPVYGKSPCRSLPVKVDDYLYYPSDTFSTIENRVEILALPTSGPWHKSSEAIDFANKIKSSVVIPTHNGLHNDIGNNIANSVHGDNLADSSRRYVYLESGQSL